VHRPPCPCLQKNRQDEQQQQQQQATILLIDPQLR
jgi:hypothetical protein